MNINHTIPSWNSDYELFHLSRNDLYTAVIGDIMDELGYINQFLPPDIKPIRSDMFMIGRAMPVLEQDYNEDEVNAFLNGEPSGSSALMLQALDEMKESEIYVCSG